MGHRKGFIRVKRKGHGPGSVTAKDKDDDVIGDVSMALHWVRKKDADPTDPSDDFDFHPTKPLVGLPADTFTIKRIEPGKVAVDYHPVSNQTQVWSYHINVVDKDASEGRGQIVGDGSATIKNR